jgi:phosphoglycerate dehydrogenase-like enzyme
VSRPRTVLAMSPAARRRLFEPGAIERLCSVADVDPELVLTEFASAEARAALGPAEVILSSWGSPSLDASALAAAPRLRALVHAAGSVKPYVSVALWRRRIVVSSAAAANAIPVAEFTLAMILLANKRAFRLARIYRERRAGLDVLAEVADAGNYAKTVGVVGASRIGRRVIELLRPHDLRVLVFDPHLDAATARTLGASRAGLDELLAGSDVVSLHAPALPSTRHMLDGRRLALLREGATLINTARGALVDHDALVAELRSGRIDAVLDVTEPEPPPPDSPLYDLPNVVLTPHIAGAVGLEIRRLGSAAVEELARYAAGRPFVHPVTEADLARIA